MAGFAEHTGMRPRRWPRRWDDAPWPDGRGRNGAVKSAGAPDGGFTGFTAPPLRRAWRSLTTSAYVGSPRGDEREKAPFILDAELRVPESPQVH